MVLRRQNLKKIPLRPQNTLKFLRHGQGEQTGEKVTGVVGHGNVGRGGAEPQTVLVFPGGTADGLPGDVHPGKVHSKSLSQTGGVIPFPAAHVQKLAGGSYLI